MSLNYNETQNLLAANNPTSSFDAVQLGTNLLNFAGNRDILTAILGTINFLTNLGYALILLFIVISGINFIVSKGSKDETKNATKGLTYALIAFLLIFLINTVFRILTDWFTGSQRNIYIVPSITETNLP